MIRKVLLQTSQQVFLDSAG